MMDEVAATVKQEKIDPEIEQKIKEHISVKKEPPDIDDEAKNLEAKVEQDCSDSNSSTDSNAEEDDEGEEEEEEAEDKKNIQLVKTSNELLAELFQVFNAAPPEELLNDEDLLKKAHRKSKKHKKEKKKRKRHKHNGDADDASNKLESNEQGIKKEKHKHKKKKKHKQRDDEKPKIKAEDKQRTRSKSKDKDKEKRKSTERQKSKDREKSAKSIDDKNSKRSLELNVDDIRIGEKNDDVRRKDDNSRKRHATAVVKTEPPAKIHISSYEKRSANNFYNGENDKERDWRTKSDHRLISSDRSRRRRHSSTKGYLDRNEISDISLSDEETYLREREHIGGSSSTMHERRQRQSYQSNHHSRSGRSAEHYRRNSRSRSKKRSRSRDLGIDKKRLLEIARKNAISMFKRGNLPGCANMSEDVKDKVLLQMRYGGRTVQDLTDFCRKISNGEPLSSMSSDNDSDVDKDGNTKAFHHPFQLKERDPIVMHLVRSKPIPSSSKTEDLTKAITMQFPVSSGQQHRRSENWMPVETKPLVPLPPLPTASLSTSIFRTDVQKNVFEKPLPGIEQQEPAFRPVDANETNTESQSADSAVETLTNDLNPAFKNSTSHPTSAPQPVANSDGFVPDVPIPSSNTYTSVFPEINSSASFDVSSIISKRLSALRRLQENPMDSEAIKMMYNSQKEMSSWASSKHLPGQFTGSTGVNVLKAHELNSGPQVWARRDQLKSTKPVTGGMGMHLLQKMGWKPGEGLGREKTGALQPLLLDVKLDKRGLVAKDDHTVINGIRNVNGSGNKKRPNNVNDVMQNFQNKHPVCILNELTSKRKWTPPLYTLVKEGGPSHSKKFLFSVSMNGQTYTPTEGSNTKKEAKMIAAKYCLEQTGILPMIQ